MSRRTPAWREFPGLETESDTWAQVMDEARRMAAHLASLKFPKGHTTHWKLSLLDDPQVTDRLRRLELHDFVTILEAAQTFKDALPLPKKNGHLD